MPGRIRTIQQFYALMRATAAVRRRLVHRLLAGGAPPPADVDRLKRARSSLAALPSRGGRLVLERRAGSSAEPLYLEAGYETLELEKDLLFLDRGEEALLGHLAALHPGFGRELEAAGSFLSSLPRPLACFISDRDGTVNNYCGRYLSSIQSAYNALFLCRFAGQACRRALLLSSAPLSGGGLEDMSVIPPGLFALAGSKGREYRDRRGRRGRLPVEAAQQRRLEQLNRRLRELLRRPDYELFGLIGSGLQLKFGQTTVARQDIHGSITPADSAAFRTLVEELVLELDPQRTTFRTEDTGLDIEIMLTVVAGGGRKEFDKGDGVLFLDGELELGLGRGPNLVCGDTASDLPMVEAAAGRSAETWVVFVTRDERLRSALRSACPRSLFVGEPDVLVAALNEAAGRGAAARRDF